MINAIVDDTFIYASGKKKKNASLPAASICGRRMVQ